MHQPGSICLSSKEQNHLCIVYARKAPEMLFYWIAIDVDSLMKKKKQD